MAAKNKTTTLSERKRESIIKNATILFRKKGFGASSMDEISAAAKVSKRTLYNHFPTKKILFREIVKIEWQKVRYPKRDTAKGFDPEDVFSDIMRHSLKVLFSPRMADLQRLVIAESDKFPELKTLQSKYGKEPLFGYFRDYVKRLGESGVLDVDRPGLAAAQYLGLVKEFIYWPWFFGTIKKPTLKQQEEVIERANKVFFSHYRKKKL